MGVGKFLDWLWDCSAFAPKIVLHFVVIARKIKSQHALVRLKNEPPRQTGAAFVKMFAQLSGSSFASRQTRLSLWASLARKTSFFVNSGRRVSA